MPISATVPESQPAASRSRGRVAWQAPKATDSPAGGSSDDSKTAVSAAPEPTPFRRGRTSRPELAVAELFRRGDDFSICGFTSGSNVDDDADSDSMTHTCCGPEDLTITLVAQAASSQVSSSSGTGLTQLDPTTRHSTTSNIFGTATHSSTTSATGAHSTNKAGDKSSSGLSPGAIGGISVGAFVLLVALLAMIWRMTKKRQMSNMAAASQSDPFGGSGGDSGLKGGPIAGAMAIGKTGGAYRQIQQQQQDQI
ncbi:hypothetical protein CMQ_2875 [Grosmannia clavigera kw1407]|uniref:Uncharacterized protein n=1 Tax=Grosmannia clavigera (strain kw1407 / UAMH 11150) TaxID=655863 RepID=F0XHU3_GROCL|nr:uncharacterized protein CMQ_2875 [Grosmannia clavigera kw1407]EFX02946.1 hypothetical protein CMQ_2875 [Grosmannia clavigera kw1407]